MKPKSSRAIRLACLVGLLGLPVDQVQANSSSDLLIIANKSVATDSASVAELRMIFLKERLTWKDGSRALPITAPRGSKLRAAFADKVLGMSPKEEDRFWQDQKIRKGLDGPAEFSNPLKAVFRLKEDLGTEPKFWYFRDV